MKSSSNRDRSSTARPVSAGISAWDLTDLEPSGGRGDWDAVDDATETEPMDPAGLNNEALLQASAREQELLELLKAERADRESLVRDAYSRGYAEGRSKGEESEAARVGDAIRAIDAALGQIRASGSRWAAALEENVCALAVAVARHILGKELRGDTVAVMDLVRDAVSKFGLDEPLKVRVSMCDYGILMAAESGEHELATLIAGREIVWAADDLVEVGGCIVEGPDRVVDGRVDTALERVYRRLTQSHA